MSGRVHRVVVNHIGERDREETRSGKPLPFSGDSRPRELTRPAEVARESESTARCRDSFPDKSVTRAFARSLQATGVCADALDPDLPARSPRARRGSRAFRERQDLRGQRHATPRGRSLLARIQRISVARAPVTIWRDVDDGAVACNMSAPLRTAR